MSLRRQIARLHSRLNAARGFYPRGSWGRNLAWEILDEIAQATPGNYEACKGDIAVAVEDGNIKEAFSILGDAAKQAIEDLEYALEEGYDVAIMEMFTDWTEQSNEDNWS